VFLTQPLNWPVLLNREPTVAVAAARKAIGNQGDGDTEQVPVLLNRAGAPSP
jgi:hypothetical protein